MANIQGASTAVVRIHNGWDTFGTGFLVLREKPKRGFAFFLVTNKHLLWKNKSDRDRVDSLTVELILVEGVDEHPTSSAEGMRSINDNLLHFGLHKITVNLVDQNEQPVWFEHPNPEVDIVCFDITGLFMQLIEANLIIFHRLFDFELLADEWLLERREARIGDEIIVIGYPEVTPAVRHEDWPFPFVKQGIIASRIGSKLVLGGESRERVLTGFLLDGVIVKGSSGSPVLLKSSLSRQNVDEAWVLTEAIVLGILAETTFAQADQETPRLAFSTFGGFGLAYDAKLIKETIKLAYRRGVSPITRTDDMIVREPGEGDLRPPRVRKVSKADRSK